MNPLVVIMGEGRLAEMAKEDLSAQYTVFSYPEVEANIPEQAAIVLVLHDAWNPAYHLKAEEILRRTRIPWLRGFVSFGEGVVGPLVRMETQGCSQCGDTRKLMAGRDRQEMWRIQHMLSEEERKESDAWASRIAIAQLVQVILSEVKMILQGKEALSQGRMFLLNLKTLNGSWHSILPDPLCHVCSTLPDDSPEAAVISLKSSPKIQGSYRCRSMEDLKNVLIKDYLDYRTGLFNEKMYDLVPPFADVGVNLPLFAGDEGVAGRTHSYAASELTAILEGLERACGISPHGKRTVVHDSYNNLKDQALHPSAAGVHAKEQYESPGFPFKEFKPDMPISWVWGYSLVEERPILVPELLAYYSLGCGHGFVYETSNGCALGGSLEEAIFYGIMEVVERDSFLLTWYAQLPLTRLDPYSANDEELNLMIQRVEAVGGYDLHFYNATMDHGIPSVWALAKNKKQRGLNLICAAGAHLDPVRAVKSTIHEMAAMMLTLDDKFENSREECIRMYQDASLVRKMDDHSLLYGLPQAEERLQFLLNEDRPLRPFDEEFKWKPVHDDLKDDLQAVLQKIKLCGMDVIVVDQTSPELKVNGLHCVKVLIPGMLPMTFGHHLTRVTGLQRVLEVPMQLGYTKQPLTMEQLNRHPHPFP
ncbi:bacteriocin biosynthesis protein SagD [Mesobacillus campisalis]|uniref:Bacteriocin biosynthesis protein SagD n=1 Tax=Mesobacillus campisalis TaxID=1408103 RepID=A0A0M2STH8_9BACI|nr:TOMM precursor leader peptide-binding protein [Mesobacillus campisalis]KKK36297.1 bacteriocin biosynthesis protein SagD [Mesobacillus campisalis]